MRFHTAIASALLATACTGGESEPARDWKAPELPALARVRSVDDFLARQLPAGQHVQSLAKASTAAAGGYRVVRLTNGPGVGVAWQTNAAGQIAGAREGIDTIGSATLWRSDGSMTDLAPQNSIFSMAPDLNARGQATIVANFEDGNSGYLFTPNVPNGTTGKLTTLFTKAADGIPGDLNDAGQVVGMYYDADGASHAFLYTPLPFDRTHGIQVNIPMPSGATGGTATHLNEYGQVAGTFFTADGEYHIYLWTPFLPRTFVGITVDLGAAAQSSFLGNPVFGAALNEGGQVIFERPGDDFGPPRTVVFMPLRDNGYLGTFKTITNDDHIPTAFAINDAGQVTFAQTDLSYENPEGFLWTPGRTRLAAGTYTSLGDRAPFALNNRGQVAGSTGSGIGSAFLWNPATPNGTTGAFTQLAALSQGCEFGVIFSLDDVGQGAGECVIDPENGQDIAAILLTNR